MQQFSQIQLLLYGCKITNKVVELLTDVWKKYRAANKENIWELICLLEQT